MTRQAVGRGGGQSEGVDHLLPRAVVTGRTGAGAVGVDIVLGVDFRPVCHGMAVAAGDAAREVCGPQGNRMYICGMLCIESTTMAGRAITRSALADGRTDQDAGVDVVTADAGVVGFWCCTDQGVVVTACTAGGTDGDESGVIKCCGRVIRLPGARVAGGTVAQSGLADGRADQGAGGGVMAAVTGVVRFG